MIRLVRGSYLLLCLGAVVPFAAQADGFTARLGTLGVGVEYNHGFSDSMELRFGVNGGSYHFKNNDGTVEYSLESKLSSADLLLDWHPFSGTFFTSFGALYNKNKFELSATTTSSTTIGGNTYPAGTNLTGETTFKTAAPYVGVGWGSAPSAKGAVWRVDLGALYQGSPQVTLRSNAVSQSDLNSEAAKLQDSISGYKYYPHIAMSFGARF